ncbi:hypothetical protein UA45_17525, partial [Morganella morganii]
SLEEQAGRLTQAVSVFQIDQVGVAVTEMDRVTQQNAALVEQSAAAAASLEEQAGRLTQAVSVFQIQAGELKSNVKPAPWYHYSGPI